MRPKLLFLALMAPCFLFAQNDDSLMIRKIADEILVNGKAYDNLRHLTKKIGARLAGSSGMVKAEINIDGETGYMSNVGDVASMSSQALSILKDDKTLKGFKERAAKHAKKYDINNIIPIYEKLYERFL